MKGIILAAGKGSRLYPMTRSICKPLLPVYDKPMIYYPLAILLQAGIRDILIIIPPGEEGSFYRLLGSGGSFGVKISYKVQEMARGIADAFLIGESFIGNDDVCLILGDSIFYSPQISNYLDKVLSYPFGACIFGYYVDDPNGFCIVELDHSGKPISIEEKPKHAKSNYAVLGLYFYDNTVLDIVRHLKLSARGKLEIADVNRTYLARNKLQVVTCDPDFVWLDTDTVDGLLVSAQTVKRIQNETGGCIACLEELAYQQGYISKQLLEDRARNYGKTLYGEYLQSRLNKFTE